MKQKDITLIVVIAVVSVILSLIVSKLVISSPKNRSAKVTIVEEITNKFPLPDKKYFNENSLDPTRLIRIGDTSDDTPFN